MKKPVDIASFYGINWKDTDPKSAVILSTILGVFELSSLLILVRASSRDGKCFFRSSICGACEAILKKGGPAVLAQEVTQWAGRAAQCVGWMEDEGELSGVLKTKSKAMARSIKAWADGFEGRARRMTRAQQVELLFDDLGGMDKDVVLLAQLIVGWVHYTKAADTDGLATCLEIQRCGASIAMHLTDVVVKEFEYAQGPDCDALAYGLGATFVLVELLEGRLVAPETKTLNIAKKSEEHPVVFLLFHCNGGHYDLLELPLAHEAQSTQGDGIEDAADQEVDTREGEGRQVKSPASTPQRQVTFWRGWEEDTSSPRASGTEKKVQEQEWISEEILEEGGVEELPMAPGQTMGGRSSDELERRSKVDDLIRAPFLLTTPGDSLDLLPISPLKRPRSTGKVGEVEPEVSPAKRPKSQTTKLPMPRDRGFQKRMATAMKHSTGQFPTRENIRYLEMPGLAGVAEAWLEEGDDGVVQMACEVEAVPNYEPVPGAVVGLPGKQLGGMLLMGLQLSAEEQARQAGIPKRDRSVRHKLAAVLFEPDCRAILAKSVTAKFEGLEVEIIGDVWRITGKLQLSKLRAKARVAKFGLVLMHSTEALKKFASEEPIE